MSERRLTLGLIAPKNTLSEKHWLLDMLVDVDAEPYRPSRKYDIVWFLNVTTEIEHLSKHTDSRLFVVGMEPEFRYRLNYESRLLNKAHYYMGYRNFSTDSLHVEFQRFVFPIYTKSEIRSRFKVGIQTKKTHDFCLFARHDPNIRMEIANKIIMRNGVVAGTIFGKDVKDKLSVQRFCKYEFITENDLNDYYVSEKLGQALAAGCVPVYLGGKCVKELYRPDLFVDMRDFLDESGAPRVDDVIEHCLSDQTYEFHRSAMESYAEEFLASRFSIESCLIDPIQTYIRRLQKHGWHSRKSTMFDRIRRARYRFGTVRSAAEQGQSRGR